MAASGLSLFLSSLFFLTVFLMPFFSTILYILLVDINKSTKKTCECGLATENAAHMLQCTLLARPCTLDDLSKYNDTARSCVDRWKTTVSRHDDDLRVK